MPQCLHPDRASTSRLHRAARATKLVGMRALRLVAIAVVALAGVAGCDGVETAARDAIIAIFYAEDAKPAPADAVAVQAVAETTPVLDGSDAADDPAIWVDPDEPGRGWLIGTNKRRGIEVYDMTGVRRWQLDAGRVNNVDLRAGVMVSGTQRIVAGATNRTTVRIDVWALDPATGELADLLSEPLPAAMDDPYGFCLYLSPVDGTLYAFATAKEGGARQWRLRDTGAGTLRGEFVRAIPTDTQPEGCVADDANRTVFIGEEDVGIWRLNAEPDSASERRLIATTRPTAEAEAPVDASPHRLTADVEGLAVYAPPQGHPDAGFLIASSQGNWTYVVFDRKPPHRYRGTFQVADGPTVDGAGETDGIDVAASPVGAAYPGGLLVVQDGYNVDADGKPARQNFKLVSWADVAAALSLD